MFDFNLVMHTYRSLPVGGPEVQIFNFPALDLLFSYYSGNAVNTAGIFV
jgi:hypothetical protein